MKYLIMFGIWLLQMFISTSIYSDQIDNTIKVECLSIRSEKGIIGVGIFKNQAEFETNKPYKLIRIPKKNILKGSMKINIPLQHGIYGLSLLDDENGNAKMDYNFIGIPKEGFAFSNYYHEGYSKPHFDKFKFIFNTPVMEIKCKFRYM